MSAGDIALQAGLSQPNTSMHLDYEIGDKRVVKLLDEAADLLLEVGPLIDMCRRYQGATVRRATRSGREKPRWRQ